MQEQANNNDDLMAKMVQAIQPIVDQQFECMGFAGQLAGRVAQLEARVEQKLDKILAEMKMVGKGKLDEQKHMFIRLYLQINRRPLMK